MRRVDALLPPSGVSYRTGEEQLHALDGDTFGLRDPDEGEDAKGISDVPGNRGVGSVSWSLKSKKLWPEG